MKLERIFIQKQLKDMEIFYCFHALNPTQFAIHNSHYIPGNYIDIIEKYNRTEDAFNYIVIAPNSNCQCVYACGKNELLFNSKSRDNIQRFYPEIFDYIAQKDFII